MAEGESTTSADIIDFLYFFFKRSHISLSEIFTVLEFIAIRFTKLPNYITRSSYFSLKLKDTI